MNKVSYNKDTLALIKRLATIQDAVVVKKEDEQIVICRSDIDKQVFYKLTAPVSHFDFIGEEIGFRQFSDFHTLFNMFNNPEMVQQGKNNDVLVVSEGKTKIKYKLSDIDYIKSKLPSPKNISFNNPDLSFHLDEPEYKNLISIKKTMKADKVILKQDSKDEITFVFKSDNHENEFEQTFSVTNNTDVSDLKMTFFANFLDKIPCSEYNLNINKVGVIQFQLVTENEYSLDIYTARRDD